MTDEQFFERLRGDAAPLRYEPDAFTLARIRARIRERIARPLARPTVAQLLAAWFRPLAATLSAIALTAVLVVATTDESDVSNGNPSIGESNVETNVEIVMAGDTYSVGQ
jgi:hypothetical protein